MKRIYNIFTLLVTVLAGLSLAGCKDGDDLNTNQYLGGNSASLNVWGPNPVMYGGTIMFKGSNLDQVSQIILPGCDPITNIEVVQAGTPSEIRIAVPDEAFGSDYVKLITNTDKEIVTKTQISFEQGIEFDAFSPASIMPGDVLTITGEYLHLVECIEFAEGVYVSKDDFIAQERNEIQVTVPDNARTGEVNLLDLDITKMTEEDIANATYNSIPSEDALEVGTPTVTALSTPRGEAEPQGTVTAKVGETITITGEYMKLVGAVKFGDVDSELGESETTEFTVNDEGTTLTLVLPADAPDGDINLVCLSGVEIPVGILETVAPTNCVAVPSPVKAGAQLTITGNDMDVVAAVEMPNVEGEIEITVSATSVVVTAVPETAQEGNLVLRMANGKGVEVPFTLVKPEVTGYDNSTVSAGGALTILGTNLDLVTSVQFGEGSDIVEVEPAADGTSISLTVPMNAVSGAPTLNLANGTSVQGKELTVNEAVFCYATELPGEEEELKAGSSMKITVANGDKLTGVQINGIDCQYVLADGNQLVIGIPESAGAGAKLRLISSNGEVSYTIEVTPNSEVSTVIWTGAVDLGNWSVNWQFGDGVNSSGENAMAFANLDLAAGDVLHVFATPYDEEWQIQFFDGHWVGLTEVGETYGNGNNVSSTIASLESGSLDITITESMLEKLTTLTDWGYCIILQGLNLVVTKISVTHYNQLETPIWTGSWDCADWAGNQDLAWGGYDWSTVKANSTLRLYWTKIDAEAWGCISLRHGQDWGNLPSPIEGQYDFADDAASGVLEVQLPKNVLDDIVANGGLVISGANFTLTKVTIE